MPRNARRRDPALRPKERLELDVKHIPFRVMCVIIALVTAALAFGSVINDFLTPPTGWQQVEPQNPQTPIYKEFALCYELGKSQLDARQEQKAVAALYGQALDQTYQALSNQPVEGCVNLYALNHQPGTALTVEDALYRAFQLVEQTASRQPYFGPLVSWYNSLFACTYDEEAALYDPARWEEAAEYAARIAGFAADPQAVRVECLPDGQLRLVVSQAYLDFARENELETFVDFGPLLNAFLCDAVADALAGQGHENGYVTSSDGFARALCDTQFGLNVIDWAQGQAVQQGTVVYQGPAALVSLRSFPVQESDQLRYYTYADGTVVGPYLDGEGRFHTASASLSAMSRQVGAAELALRAYAAFTGSDPAFPALEECSWVSVRQGEITLHGDDFQLVQPDS